MLPSSVPKAGVPSQGRYLLALGATIIALSLAASPDLRGGFGAALGLLMLMIAVSDLRAFIIPNPLSGAAFALGLVFGGLFDDFFTMDAVIAALIRAAVTALPFLALMVIYQWWRGRPGLGLGDVKLAAVAGVWLHWIAIAATIEVAALAALAGFAIWRFVLRRSVTATTRMPFGLFLAPAIWLGWLGEALLRRFAF